MQGEDFWQIEGSIIFEGKRYDTKVLRQRQTQVERLLLSLELDKRKVVGIYRKRDAESLVLMMALLRQGIPFLSMDITYPQARLNYMAEKRNMETIFIDKETKGVFSHYHEIDLEEAEWKKEGDNSAETVDFAGKEEDIAYYFYTSGSTGEPKAVEVLQKTFRNFMIEMPAKLPLKVKERIVCFASVSFDLFFMESLLPLLLGMEVVLASEEERDDTMGLQKLLKTYQIQALQITPSHLQMIQYLDPRFSCLQSIECLMVGAETIPFNLLEQIRANCAARIFNLYGPTETTVWTSVGELVHTKEIHIGTPIKNTFIYILNERGKPVEKGEIGELCIAGAGVSNGYPDDEKLTKEKFIEASFQSGLRLYKTGDLGKFDGEFYYCLGRKDNQVKYLGHRIELEEVEACGNRIPGVRRTLAAVMKKDGSQKLVLLYEGETAVSKENMREIMKQELPPYMTPDLFIPTEHLYYNHNGKMDRRENYKLYLKPLEEDALKMRKCAANQKEAVLEIIQKELQWKEPLELSQPLEELGMNSLGFVKLVVALEDFFHIEFEEKMLSGRAFETLGDLYSYVMAHVNGNGNGMNKGMSC